MRNGNKSLQVLKFLINRGEPSSWKGGRLEGWSFQPSALPPGFFSTLNSSPQCLIALEIMP